MRAVDIATGPAPPSYTLEVSERLKAHADCRLLPSRTYAASSLGTAYRMLDHPRRIRHERRPGSLLHVDSQLLAYVLASRLARPRVITCYDIVPFLPELDDPSYVSRDGMVHRMYFRRLARGLGRADRIVVPSESVRSDLRRLGYRLDKIDVVPLGVDRGRFRPREPAECEAVLRRLGIHRSGSIVLFVGTEHPRKNLPRLFRAFAQLQELGATLVKVGMPRHPQREQLRALASDLGIQGRVTFLDRVSDEDLAVLYAAADVLVLPSLYEGFGLPPLEAMACGTPVAVARATSLPEVVGDAGLYFDPADQGKIADELRRILTDRTLREDLRSRGLARSAMFSWERTMNALLRTYSAAEADLAAGKVGGASRGWLRR